MVKWLAALTASVALVATGLVHGFWTDRWQPPADVAAAAARLDEVPLEVGPWKGQVMEVKANQLGAGVAGCVQRRYENRQTGAVVVLALVCGRPGPVSIHTPDACYGASGYLVGSRERVTLPGELGSFWKTDAGRTTTTDEIRLRIYYGWHSTKGWEAPDDSRPAFARERVLHKLYVLRELAGAGENPREEPCEAFLEQMLPRLSGTALTASP
jgi:hypothetical protein